MARRNEGFRLCCWTQILSPRAVPVGAQPPAHSGQAALGLQKPSTFSYTPLGQNSSHTTPIVFRWDCELWGPSTMNYYPRKVYALTLLKKSKTSRCWVVYNCAAAPPQPHQCYHSRILGSALGKCLDWILQFCCSGYNRAFKAEKQFGKHTNPPLIISYPWDEAAFVPVLICRLIKDCQQN